MLNLKKLLYNIPILAMFTFMTVLILFSTAYVVGTLCMARGMSMYMALFTSIVMAIITLLFVRYNHNIRNHLDGKD